MNKFKYILALVLTLAVAVSLTACIEIYFPWTCEEHTDTNADGICDKCEEKIEKSKTGGISLIKDGELSFGVVLGSTFPSA